MSPAQSKRLLITGAAGFTGHHMVLEACRAGFEVRATDVSSHHYGAMFDALGVDFVRSDLTRPEGLEALLTGVEAVVHVAGVHDYSAPHRLLFAVNVKAVENLCVACERTSVNRFVHISSAAVYGYDWHDRTPVAEDAPKLTPPLNSYNLTKWEGEKVVHRHIREHGLRATILRPAAIYGPRCEYGIFNAIRHVWSHRNRKRVPVIGRGDRIEGFVHVRDVCRAAMFALADDGTIGEIYNLSDDSRLTTCEFFNLVSRELTGREKEFLHVPPAILISLAVLAQLAARVLRRRSPLEKGALQYLTCDRVWDNRKIKAAGFEFEYPAVESGMIETIRWYKENGWLGIERSP